MPFYIRKRLGERVEHASEPGLWSPHPRCLCHNISLHCGCLQGRAGWSRRLKAPFLGSVPTSLGSLPHAHGGGCGWTVTLPRPTRNDATTRDSSWKVPAFLRDHESTSLRDNTADHSGAPRHPGHSAALETVPGRKLKRGTTPPQLAISPKMSWGVRDSSTVRPLVRALRSLDWEKNHGYSLRPLKLASKLPWLRCL